MAALLLVEWNDHSASSRLALHRHNRTLHPVQLRFLGCRPQRIIGMPGCPHGAPWRLVMPALLALAAGPAGAQVVCTASAQTVAFGAYDTRSPAPRDSTGNIAITCRGLTGQSASYAIALSAGLAGSVAKRTLRSASGALAYNLYVDAARTRVWGDGVAGSVTLTDAYTLGALAVTRNYPVYGRLPGSQNVPVGFYTDTITVTVSF